MRRGRSGASWAVLATGLATALLVSPEAARSPLRSLGLSIGKPVAMAAGALLCAIACALAWRGRRLTLDAVAWAALGTLGCGLVAAVVNGTQLPFALPWLAMQLSGLVVMAAASTAARGGAAERARVMDGVVLVATAIAVIAIYEAAGGELWWDAPRRPGATFGNRNAVGGFCAIALPLAMARIWEQAGAAPQPGRARRRALWLIGWRGLALALLVLAVLLCRARSSWLALLLVSAAAAGLALAAWRRRARPGTGQLEPDAQGAARAAEQPDRQAVRPETGQLEPDAQGAPRAAEARGQRRRAMSAIAAAVAVAFVAMAAVPWRLEWKEASPMAASLARLLDYESGTGKSRVEQHQVGLQMVAARPLFGFGPGTWRREAPRFAHAAPGQHAAFIAPLWTPASDLLRHVVETGLVGMAMAAVLVALLLRGGWRRLRRGAEAATVALLASLAVALIISGFDALLARPASLVLVATIAGLLHAEATGEEAGRAGARPRWSVAGGVSGAAMIGAAAIAMIIFLPRYLAARQFARDFTARAVLANDGASFLPYESAQALAARGPSVSCESGARAAAIALRYLPNEPRLLQRLARCAERRPGDAATRARARREASELWRRSLQIEPHDEEAVRALNALSP